MLVATSLTIWVQVALEYWVPRDPASRLAQSMAVVSVLSTSVTSVRSLTWGVVSVDSIEKSKVALWPGGRTPAGSGPVVGLEKSGSTRSTEGAKVLEPGRATLVRVPLRRRMGTATSDPPGLVTVTATVPAQP